jgi:MFS family permease
MSDVTTDPVASPAPATAFALPAAGFTLLFGRVADIAGRRRMLLAGLALLVVASVVGGLAGDTATLLAARAGQGLAAAIAVALLRRGRAGNRAAS